MALLKPIEHPRTGAVATYWRIVRATFDEPANYVLAGYLDKAARDAGREPMQEISIFVERARDAPMSRIDMYADAKTRGEFKDATDSQLETEVRTR